MKNQAWMRNATHIAEKVYIQFLDVVEEHIIERDRENRPLSERNRKQIEKGTHIDPRVPRLMTISGKGGFSRDPIKNARYGKFYNVTLLDHLLSVTRGTLILLALDTMVRNPNIEIDELKKRLSVGAVIAFMHDTDKDLRLERNAPIPLDGMADRMNRYGIADFLETAGVPLLTDQLRYLVENVEASQSHRHPPANLPPRSYENLPRYVRLADQLDGAWCVADGDGRLKGVLNCLSEDRGSLRSDMLKEWRTLHIFDPLHPFLLDELQRYLSVFCIRMAGIPPLIETHQDGHLFMMMPEYNSDEIIDQAIDSMTAGLPFNLNLNVTNRGTPALYNGSPSHIELKEFVLGLESKQVSDLFRIKDTLRESIVTELDDLLEDIDLQPRWPEKITGQLVSIYTGIENFEPEAREWLFRAAYLVMLLNLKMIAKPKDRILKSDERERELLELMENKRPGWIEAVDDPASRRTVTGLWATAEAYEDDKIQKSIWGDDDGILKRWLEGRDDRAGFNQFFGGDVAAILAGVKQRFKQLLSGQRVAVKDEYAKGRCIFTDEPVPFGNTISQATGLYGVKVSAFSGREGRPETVTSERSHTNVGYTSIAERRLQSITHKEQGGRVGGVPTLISSPTTSGLFGGLAITDERSMGAMSIYDLSRTEVKKGKVVRGIEMYHGRHRLARLERMPERLVDQVDTLRLLLTACRRIGRPLHIFRGLPTSRKEFFYFDAMPNALQALVGGKGLCLEQIPEAVRQLEIAYGLLDTPGLGYDLLKQYAMPQTRFGAACMVAQYLCSRGDKQIGLVLEMETIYLKYLKGEMCMNEQDGALVKFGTAAAGIQKNPGGRASGSDKLLVFKICLDAVSTATKNHQTDRDSLVFAVIGELDANLVRRGKAAARENRNGDALMVGCERVAKIFVDEVWNGVMKGRFPSQKSRRVLSSIYWVAFLKAHREIAAQKK